MALLLPNFFRRCTYITKIVTSVMKHKNFGSNTECSEEPFRKGLLLGCWTGEKGEPILTPAAQKFSDGIGGKLTQLIKESGVQMRTGKVKMFTNLDQHFSVVAVAGLGLQKVGYNEMENLDEDRENVRVAAGAGAKKLQKNGVHCICTDGMNYPEQAAEGAALAVWKFQEYKNKKDWIGIPNLQLYEGEDQDSWQRGLFKAESQNLVRKLCDAPGNKMTPLHFAQHTVNELCPCGIKVEVHDKDWIENKKMNMFLMVARGSCAPPLFLEINYCGGNPDLKPIVMVGKGITFDSGGLCIKSARHMYRHKAEMAGAAVVISTIRAASALSLPLNLTGLLPLCENMPSGMAMKVGDVITGMNGKTIKIEHTCNEGRLMLSDALVYSQTAYKPRLIIDVSTESKGITAALGAAATGVFSNSHTMWKEIRKAGAVTGDRVWRMPLWKFYTKNVTSNKSVDIVNKGYGKADACLAAAFLQEFISCVDWLHLDINGTGMVTHDGVLPYLKQGRMSGRPTRTLIQLLYQLACSPEKS